MVTFHISQVLLIVFFLGDAAVTPSSSAGAPGSTAEKVPNLSNMDMNEMIALGKLVMDNKEAFKKLNLFGNGNEGETKEDGDSKDKNTLGKVGLEVLGKIAADPKNAVTAENAKEIVSKIVTALPEDVKLKVQEKMASALAKGIAAGIISTMTGFSPFTLGFAWQAYTKGSKFFKENINPSLNYRVYQEYSTQLLKGTKPLTAMNAAREKFSDEFTYTQTEPKVLLGCEFEDENKYTYDYQKKKSKWGRELPPMIFKTEADFKTFYKNLTNICTSVLQSTTYNDVDQLVRLVIS